MPTPETRPAAQDRKPGLARPATRVDPHVPLPAVLDLVQAAALRGVGRTTAYPLVHELQWPTPVLRPGRLCACPILGCAHAARLYSWMRPPRRSCRMTLKSLLVGSCKARSGAACRSARCGR
jgi:hypothetical protein